MEDRRDAIRELYAVPLDEFVAERTRRARDARAAGDTDLAEALRGARKPTLAAWLLNQVSGRDPDLVGRLLELSAGFTSAYRSGEVDQVRTLSKRRRDLVAAVAELAQRVAADNGRAVSGAVAEEVSQTVSAAIADPEVADAFRDGVLAQSVRYSGFGPALEAVPAAPGRPPRPAKARPAATARTQTGPAATAEPPTRTRAGSAAAARAERERQRREQAVLRAEQDRQAAAETERQARERLADLDGSLETLRRQLNMAMRDRDRAARAHDAARAALDRATDRLSQVRGET